MYQQRSYRVPAGYREVDFFDFLLVACLAGDFFEGFLLVNRLCECLELFLLRFGLTADEVRVNSGVVSATLK